MVVIIDFHCHILPGLDDGAGNWDESLEIACFLVSQGVTGVVATPHWLEGFFTPKVADILSLVDQLQQKLHQAGINLQVYPGSEVELSPSLPELVRQGTVLTINNGGRYLLVELPFNELPKYTEEVLFRLKIDGITPVIAHPERNARLAKHTDELIPLIRMGCLTQINAGSFAGLYGTKAETAVCDWLKQKAVHLLGSDLHNCAGEMMISNAVAKLSHWGDREEAQMITEIRAKRVLAGEQAVVSKPLEGLGKKGLLKKFIGKIIL